jgi:hypothetical protein
MLLSRGDASAWRADAAVRFRKSRGRPASDSPGSPTAERRRDRDDRRSESSRASEDDNGFACAQPTAPAEREGRGQIVGPEGRSL